MMLLITYDVDTTSTNGARRLRRVARACINYGHRVQNSVFECMLTQAQYVTLRAIVGSIIDPQLDSVRFYFLGKNWQRRIEHLGRETALDFEGDLII